MNITPETYKKYATARAERSPILKNCTGLCHMSKEDAGTLTACTLVLIAAVLTGFGIFDRIAKFAGAGTLVPITGFANAVVSPAIDSKSEGLIPGVGTKIFTVAGPVLLYGTLAGVVYGVIYWIVGLL